MRIDKKGSISDSNFSVQQYNNKVDKRSFIMDRLYYGNMNDTDIESSKLYENNPIDLVDCDISILLTNPDDKIVEGTNLTVTNLDGDTPSTDDDKISINWLIDNTITQTSGKRSFQLVFTNENVEYRSQIMNFNVNPSLNPEENIITIAPNLVSEWEEKLNSISSSYDVYVANTTDNPVKTETEWLASLKGETGAGVKNGGTTGQILVKNSNTDYDTKWSTLILKGTSVPSSLEEGQLFLLYK